MFCILVKCIVYAVYFKISRVCRLSKLIEITKHVVHPKATAYAFGHLLHNSSHNDFVSIQPKPGKKSVRYNKSGLFSLTSPTLPLSFHAETHQSVGSFSKREWVPKKYSKKSGDMSKSSEIIGKW